VFRGTRDGEIRSARAWRSALHRQRLTRVAIAFWLFNALLVAIDVLDRAWVALHRR
jgi:hypothetical protein